MIILSLHAGMEKLHVGLTLNFMEIHPLLEDLAKWREEEHFFSERYFWWYGFSGLNGPDWINKNLEKDVYNHPTQIIDFKTGKPVYEISEFKFSYNIGLKIQQEFKTLNQKIQENEIILDKESQRKSFRFLLLEQLKEILKDTRTLDIPSLYRNIINERLEEGVRLLENSESQNNKPLSGWYFQYGNVEYLSDVEKNDRKRRIHYFYEDLVRNNLIKGTNQNKKNLRNLLDNKTLNDHIIWIATKSELVYFIRKLVKKEYIKSENHWIAVQACFKIFKNEKEYPTNGLKSEKGTQSIRKRKKIGEIISNLEY